MSDTYEQKRRKEREVASVEPFQRWISYLRLAGYGYGVEAFDRVRRATMDVREYRQAHNQRGGDYEAEILAVRVAADTFASQIAAAAGPDQDPATVAWVVAGLSCPSAPFCQGCPACQTVTSPGRRNDERHARW